MLPRLLKGWHNEWLNWNNCICIAFLEKSKLFWCSGYGNYHVIIYNVCRSSYGIPTSVTWFNGVLIRTKPKCSNTNHKAEKPWKLYIHIKLHTWYISYVNFSIRFNHITIENIKFNLPNVVNLTSWTTGQFLVMSRKVISHLYSPSSEVLISSILNLASEVSDSICSWPLRKRLNDIL